MDSSNQLTSFPSYKQVSNIESCVARAKDIFTRHPKALLITGIALSAVGALAITLEPLRFCFLPFLWP